MLHDSTLLNGLRLGDPLTRERMGSSTSSRQ